MTTPLRRPHGSACAGQSQHCSESCIHRLLCSGMQPLSWYPVNNQHDFGAIYMKAMIPGGWNVRGRLAMSNIILAPEKVPWRRKGQLLVNGMVRGGPALPNKILAMLKRPSRRTRWFLVDGKGRGRPVIQLLTLLKALCRKKWFLVDEIFRRSTRNQQTIHMKSHAREIT